MTHKGRLGSSIEEFFEAMGETEEVEAVNKYDTLPTWEEIVYLTGWKDAACPAAHRDYDARKAVEILHKLTEGLPKHIPIYAWGSPEWKAELCRLKQLRCDNPACDVACEALHPMPCRVCRKNPHEPWCSTLADY